ncbi:MAG: TAXI family TRAP transporter solute-binding subunit [Candidatus Marinimicrobia bacterium]|nr:TAXI family TRAP transporter solute-binding subunit [Candidatus Neomarinimicrobiota bacterium]
MVLASMLLLHCSDDSGTAKAKLQDMYTFAGGPSGGTFQYYASAVATIGQKQGQKLLARSSGGSIENIRLVNSQKADFAVAYSGHVYAGAHGTLKNDENSYDNVLAMAYLYGAPAQLVVKVGSGINTPLDLVGKRVGVGNAGSGAAANAEIYFNSLGIWDQMDREFLGYRNAATAMQNGQLDAFWVFTGYPSASILEVAMQTDIRLLDTYAAGESVGLFGNNPFFTPVTIPANTYKGQSTDIASFQDGALLVANSKVPNAVIHQILTAMYGQEGLEYLVSVHNSAKSMSVETGLQGVITPIHPGAIQFWLEKGLNIPAMVE